MEHCMEMKESYWMMRMMMMMTTTTTTTTTTCLNYEHLSSTSKVAPEVLAGSYGKEPLCGKG